MWGISTKDGLKSIAPFMFLYVGALRHATGNCIPVGLLISQEARIAQELQYELKIANPNRRT